MSTKHSLSKKVLSVFLTVLMVVAMIPAITLTFKESNTVQAYSNFTKNYINEYYYVDGTQFIKGLVAGYDSKKLSTVQSQMSAAGWTMISGWDFAAGTKNGDYIGIGYAYTSNPSEAITAPRFWATRRSHDNSGIDSSINGYTVTFNKVNVSPEHTYRDNSVDFLDGVDNANWTYLYVTRDHKAGPPITSVAGGSSTSDLTNSGYTVATSFQATTTACEITGGKGSSRYLGYKSSNVTQINSDNLRKVYAAAKNYYENGGSGASNITTYLNTAQSILNDLSDGYTKDYTQTNIDSATRNLLTCFPSMPSSGSSKTITISNAGAGMFYKYTASNSYNQSNNHTFLTDSASDTKMYIYQSQSSGCGYNTTSTANNDDIGSSTYKYFNLPTSNDSYINTNLTNGTTYYIYVHFYSSSTTGSITTYGSSTVNAQLDGAGGTLSSGVTSHNVPNGSKVYPSNMATYTKSGCTLLGWRLSNGSPVNRATYV